MTFSRVHKTILYFSFLLLAAMTFSACESPEEVAENHLNKGKDLFEKGEYDKAILELKTSSQSGDQRSDTYYYMALLDEKSNNFKAMRENLQKTLELDPGNLDARQKLGKVHLLFGDLEPALEQADFILQQDPSSQEAKLLKASVYIRQKKGDAANELIDAVLSANANNIDAISLKAAQAFESNQIDKALSLVDAALKIDEKNLPLRLFKIKINAKQNNSNAVIDDYKALIELYPDAENFKLSLASLYSMTDKLEPAETLLREMVAKKPKDIEPKLVLLEFLNAKAKDRVSAEFKSMVADLNGNQNSIIELSKWMLVAGYTDDAINGLNQVVETDRASKLGLSAQSILAEIDLNKKDYDKAEKAITEILAINSDFVEASLLKARLMMIKGQTDAAIDVLNKAIWSKNDSDDAFMLLGQAYSIKKDKKQADKNFKQALELNPANLQAFAPIYGGYLQANQKETARQYLEKALKAKPNQVSLLTYKADLDISEKRWDDAQETVQRIALFSKNKSVPLYLQANILQGKAQYADAIKLYEKLLDDFPNHLNSLVNLVRSYEALNQRDKALKFLENLHSAHKDNLMVLGVLSDLYMANKDFQKAKDLMLSQIKSDPGQSAPIYLALAKVEASLSKSPEEVKNVYQKGLKDNPDNQQILMALAGLHEQLGQKDQARSVYEQIIEKNPNNNLAINNLAALLADSKLDGDRTKALSLAERFKDADNVYLQDTYAWALVKNGQVKQGLDILESLILKQPKMPELRYHLGVAHMEMGNKATAVSELKQGLTLSDKGKRNFSGKDEAVKLLQELERR